MESPREVPSRPGVQTADAAVILLARQCSPSV
jgi:hypothetical protein